MHLEVVWTIRNLYMRQKWRLIDSGPCSAAYNMAIDEAIAYSVEKEMVPPTLRLYEWNSLAVTIGYFQRISDIDIEYCKKNDIPVIRRPTGGRAILHGDDITYSFSTKTKTDFFSNDLFESYKKISEALILALSKINLSAELILKREKKYFMSYSQEQRSPLCFNSASFGEITVNNKKIIGSAQKRWVDCLLQQGTIPIFINKGEIIRIFKLGQDSIENSLIGLKDLLEEIDVFAVKENIWKSFEEKFEIEMVVSSLTEEELQLAKEIEVRKYQTDKWNFKR